jgi:hypothetical protein
MSSTPLDVTPSRSPLSNAESDALQTINLGQAVVQLVREPVSLLWKHVEKRKSISMSLGDWEKQAYQGGNQLHLPLLQTKRFESFLAMSAAHCRPKGQTSGGASWCYLLYALGIQPSDGIMQWKAVVDEFLALQDGEIEMEVPGAVLCHIVNCYAIPERDCMTRLHKRADEQGECTFSFGLLRWEEEANGRAHAHFRP